ncbi:hypothetical protein GRI89_17070 [Altererythrobacter salegens]|uniref:Uncharacterized protein n=1 Tax=Croceibacterium salegens TaxID=1737568 RepID=A0A6I4T1B7_9SPHN|nr:hypothetical protein [Croceibacterium salegens]MXO61258.1 hypothetical protein [Croceibacterium salegens]
MKGRLASTNSDNRAARPPTGRSTLRRQVNICVGSPDWSDPAHRELSGSVAGGEALNGQAKAQTGACRKMVFSFVEEKGGEIPDTRVIASA